MSEGLSRQVTWDTRKCYSSLRKAGPAAPLEELSPGIDSPDIIALHGQLQRAFKTDLHALRHLMIAQMEEKFASTPDLYPVLVLPTPLTMLRSLKLE